MPFKKTIDPKNPTHSMGLKVRLYPTDDQIDYFHRAFGTSRFTYDSLLGNLIKVCGVKKNGLSEIHETITEKHS